MMEFKSNKMIDFSKLITVIVNTIIVCFMKNICENDCPLRLMLTRNICENDCPLRLILTHLCYIAFFVSI